MTRGRSTSRRNKFEEKADGEEADAGEYEQGKPRGERERDDEAYEEDTDDDEAEGDQEDDEAEEEEEERDDRVSGA
eukprot:7959419-Pyramimonas_sp.AAC.1